VCLPSPLSWGRASRPAATTRARHRHPVLRTGPGHNGAAILPYGNLAAPETATTDNTVAVLLGPTQGEAGALVPRPGYLAGARDLSHGRDVLFISDETQSAPGLTVRAFACEHEGVVPDMYILGEASALGAVSAVVSSSAVPGVFGPGEHGSTFGCNPLAVRWRGRSRRSTPESSSSERQSWATHLHREVGLLVGGGAVEAVRGRGLWARRRHHTLPRHRPRDLRTPGGAGRAGEGHPRLDHPHRPAPGDQRGRPGSGTRPPTSGTRRLTRCRRPLRVGTWHCPQCRGRRYRPTTMLPLARRVRPLALLETGRIRSRTAGVPLLNPMAHF
jgi:hypothetical protein